MPPVYFEDLQVGQRFTSGSITVDAEMIKAFAREYDPQPFHTDEAAAKDSIFGGLAASGWHTAALTMRLNVEAIPIAGGIVGGGGEISWPRPTRPGDVLRVEAEILEIVPSRSRPDRGRVTVKFETRNQNGEAVQVATMQLVVPKRPRP